MDGVWQPIEVSHDVFTSDIVANRLLLAALDAIRRLPHSPLAAKQEISRARRLFGEGTR
jgi:hypothetical protein